MNDLISIANLSQQLSFQNGIIKEYTDDDYFDILKNQKFYDIHLKSGKVIRVGKYAKRVPAGLIAACIDTMLQLSNDLLLIKKTRLYIGIDKKTSNEVIKQSHVSYISDCNGHKYNIICEKDYI